MFLATMDVYQDAWPLFSVQQNPNITKVFQIRISTRKNISSGNSQFRF